MKKKKKELPFTLHVAKGSQFPNHAIRCDLATFTYPASPMVGIKNPMYGDAVDKLHTLFERIDVKDLPKVYGNLKKQAMNIIEDSGATEDGKLRLRCLVEEFLKQPNHPGWE